jgi:hypothetical protein
MPGPSPQEVAATNLVDEGMSRRKHDSERPGYCVEQAACCDAKMPAAMLVA